MEVSVTITTITKTTSVSAKIGPFMTLPAVFAKTPSDGDTKRLSVPDVLTLLDLQPGVGIGIAGNAVLHIVESGLVTMQSNSALVAEASIARTLDTQADTQERRGLKEVRKWAG